MRKQSISLLLAAVFLLLASAARADQVFPPSNSAECGANTVLAWSGDGDVYCKDPASGMAGSAFREWLKIEGMGLFPEAIVVEVFTNTGQPAHILIPASVLGVSGPPEERGIAYVSHLGTIRKVSEPGVSQGIWCSYTSDGKFKNMHGSTLDYNKPRCPMRLELDGRAVQELN